MARLFVSHAKENRPIVGRLVEALREERFDVWWDQDLAPGEAYAEVIEARLTGADCGIVCWSKSATAAGRHWVRGEAERMRDRVISVLLDDVELPVPFNMGQALRLVEWQGHRECDAFQQLVAGIRAKLEQRRLLSLAPKPTSRRRALLIGVGSYEAGAGLVGLPAPIVNVNGLERALRREACGFQVAALRNPTKQQIETAVEDYFPANDASDLLVIYYSGHIHLPEPNTVFLTGKDSERGRHRSQAFALNRLEREFLAKSTARDVVLIFDVCCLDAEFDAVATALQSTLGAGRTLSVLVSTHDASVEALPHGEHCTRFTARLVRALESDDADSNGDGVITADELFQFIDPAPETTPRFHSRHWSFASSPSAIDIRRRSGTTSEELRLSPGQQAFADAFKIELEQGNILPFLGDGIYGTGPLSFFQVARTLARQAGISGERHQDMIATAAESLELHLQDRTAFLGRLRQIFDAQAAECAPPAIHDLIVEMKAPWLVVSVNYDNLLESRLDRLGRPYVVLAHVLRSGGAEESTAKDREAGKVLVLRSQHHPLVKENAARAFELCVAQDVALRPDDCVIYKLLGSPCWQQWPEVSAQQLDTVVITESDHIDFLVHLRNEVTGMPPALSLKLRRGKLAFFEYNLDVWHYRLIGHLFRGKDSEHRPGAVVLKRRPYMLRTPTSPTEELFWRRRFNPDSVPVDLTTFVRAVRADK